MECVNIEDERIYGKILDIASMSAKHGERIRKAVEEEVFDSVLMRLPHDERVYLPQELSLKLRHTGLMRNLEKKIYTISMNELWIRLSPEEILEFFYDVFVQVRQARITFFDEDCVEYSSPRLYENHAPRS